MSNSTHGIEDDAARLEREGDRIREHMDRTLDELGQKLSPGQLIDRSVDFLRENGSRIVGEIGGTVRRHPVPTLVACAGLAWLATAVFQAQRDESIDDDDEGDDYEPEDWVPEEASGVRARVRNSVRATRYKSQRAIRTARNRVSGTTSDLRDSVAEHPVAFGALAVAVGAAVGSAIPVTEAERRTIPPLRERAVARAEEIGQRTYDRVRGAFDNASESKTRQASGDVPCGADTRTSGSSSPSS